ncbi:MAG: hypothetical protein LH660_09180 [Phormidesmis sp. CAN_BIN36]|nr:hypothetical protein [Phormidesmis sp. CAN_BIN36]
MELVIDMTSGEAFASISETARMVEKGESTIRYFLTSQEFVLKSAEINTQTGLKTAQLLNELQIYDVCEKYKPSLLKASAQAGLRVYLHKVAGFEVQSTAIPQQPKANPFDGLGDAITAAVAELVRIELAKQVQSPSPDLDRPRAELPPSIVKLIDKREKTKQAYVALIEILDQWCKPKKFPNQLFADCAFLVAAKNGEISGVNPLLPFLKWGNSSGLSRATLCRARKKIKDGETLQKDPWAERDR